MSLRAEKVASLLQREAARVIAEEYAFTGLAVSVNKVDVSPDLKNARVYVGMVGRGQAESKTVLERSAPGLIARRIAQRTDLRSVPRISLVFDDSGEYAEHISRLINDIK